MGSESLLSLALDSFREGSRAVVRSDNKNLFWATCDLQVMLSELCWGHGHRFKPDPVKRHVEKKASLRAATITGEKGLFA